MDARIPPSFFLESSIADFDESRVPALAIPRCSAAGANYLERKTA
jgi:hypothetical protein